MSQEPAQYHAQLHNGSSYPICEDSAACRDSSANQGGKKDACKEDAENKVYDFEALAHETFGAMAKGARRLLKRLGAIAAASGKVGKGVFMGNTGWVEHRPPMATQAPRLKLATVQR